MGNQLAALSQNSLTKLVVWLLGVQSRLPPPFFEGRSEKGLQMWDRKDIKP